MNFDKDRHILLVDNITKSFPGVMALKNVSLEVQKGQVHGIVGENGAGKSTLMKILSGVHTPDSGYFVFDGQKVERTTPVESLKMGLSIIYQEFNLVNMMSVGENIFLGRFKEVHGMKGTHKKARELLDSIGCEINTHTLVNDLSVSEKQMVEIAKALSFDSKLIIMDEPSSSLTANELQRLKEIIRNLKNRGISILYISHKLDEIFELCDTVTVMRDGMIIDTKPISEMTRSEMIAKMIGRSIDQEYPERAQYVGDTIMKVSNINTRKLKNISFELKKGEILGLVGLVGSGRTEIVRAIFGADKVKEKEIIINNKRVNIRSPKDAIKAGMGFVTEDRKQLGLVLKFSVESNISMGNLNKILKGLFINNKLEREMAEKHINDLSIKTPSRLTKVVTLSGGNQQKVIVGRWMESNPQILILDEPTRGIDVGAKYEIYLLMKRIAEAGGAIILISSELPEVLNMSNRVLTICDGRITGEFNPVTTDANEIMDKAIG
jgi:ribose transport system ATP-binding protein